MPTALIAGGDGRIGRAAARRLAAAGVDVIATTRRNAPREAGQPHLDLAAPPETWPAWNAEFCLIAAAVTSLDACRRDADGTHKVNVTGAAELARRQIAAGGFVLFLSSNQVFDGTTARRCPADRPSPVGEYGRQKAMAEGEILGLGDRAAVLRLTKVLAPDLPLLKGWMHALDAGDQVNAFEDMMLAPVTLDTVVEAIARIFAQRAGGMHHLSGDADVTYLEVARTLACRLGREESSAQPQSAAHAGFDASMLPRHTTLACPTLAKLGISPPRSSDAISLCLDELVGAHTDGRRDGHGAIARTQRI